jgi:predicted nucleic acid-binding protein
MSTDLIDSNLIVYAAQPEHDELRGYIADEAPAIYVGREQNRDASLPRSGHKRPSLSRISSAWLSFLLVSQNVVEEAIRLRQKRNMSLGDALIAGTARPAASCESSRTTRATLTG